MVIIHARLYVKPEFAADFLEKTKPLVAASQAEEGNISYELFQHTVNPNEFIVVEEWKDLAAIEFHNQTPHFTGFFAQAGDWFSQSAEIKRFAVANG
jgi:quinol monooxygenase YgiN